MSPELYTNKGQVKAVVLEDDNISTIERVGTLVSAIQKLLRNRRFDIVNAVFKNSFPTSYANEFTSAILEKREGSIKYKILENGDIQINEVSFPQDRKQKGK